MDPGDLVRQLGSGRAYDPMSGSQGLSALCLSFYLHNFMGLEPRPLRSWRNFKTMLSQQGMCEQ